MINICVILFITIVIHPSKRVPSCSLALSEEPEPHMRGTTMTVKMIMMMMMMIIIIKTSSVTLEIIQK